MEGNAFVAPVAMGDSWVHKPYLYVFMSVPLTKMNTMPRRASGQDNGWKSKIDSSGADTDASCTSGDVKRTIEAED